MAGLSSAPGRPWRWRLVAAVVGVTVLLAGGGVAIAYKLSSDDDSAVGRSASSAPPAASPSPSRSPSPTPPSGADITGPLNFLLVGIDTRESVPDWQPHADSVLVLHVTKELDRAYLFSLPRDLVVDIPAFPKAHFSGAQTKLTNAMSYGSRVPGTDKANTAQGLQLLSTTIGGYTGITRFDAAAVLNFRGMRDLVDAIGGVDLYVDRQVASIHLRPDGRGRAKGNSSTGYVGPQKVYPVGMQHLNGWQALDFARQRYGLPNGDYDRQRHQRQLIKALVGQMLGQGTPTAPGRLGQVLGALQKTLTFDGHGRQVAEYAYALRAVTASSITLIDLPGRSVGSAGSYRGEQLDPVAKTFFAAVRADTIDAFLSTHPGQVNK